MDIAQLIGSSEQVGQIPDDIWIIIFKYFADFPVLFNLYNVNNSQLTRVLDNYFNKDLTIDFAKYAKLNKSMDIVNQMSDIVRTVNGIIIDTFTFEDMHLVAEAFQTILERNSSELFHCTCADGTQDEVAQSVCDVLNRAINLVDVRVDVWMDARHVIKLSHLVNLRSLELRSCYCTVTFPTVGLTDLRLENCRMSEIAVRQLLIGSEHTLVSLYTSSLSLPNTQPCETVNSDNSTMSLVFPKLKYITMHRIMMMDFAGKKECSFEINLSQSLYLESIYLSLNGYSRIKVVGYNFQTLVFIKDVSSLCDAVDFESFADARLQSLTHFQYSHCENLASATTTFKRIAHGCDHLECLVIYTNNEAVWDEFFYQVSKILKNNTKLQKIVFSYCGPHVLQSIIKSIIETKNESLENIHFGPNAEYDPDQSKFSNDLIADLTKWGYKRSKSLHIKTHKRMIISDEFEPTFMSRFNIKFTIAD